MTLQGLLSNVLDVQRNLHPVNENTMAEIALPIFLGLKKELISLLFYLFIYLFGFLSQKKYKGSKEAFTTK